MSQRFVYFDAETGRILHDSPVENEAFGTSYILADVPDRVGQDHRVESGELVAMPTRNLETEWPLVRARRNQLLAACDFTQLPDSPQDKHAWAVYRQALRDVTTQPDPFNLTWPTAPGA